MAATFPCTTGTVALYTSGEQVLAVPVEAWDDKGAAYIAGADGLIPATDRAGFEGLEMAMTALPPRGRPVRTPVRSGPRPDKGRRERPEA